MTKQTTLVWFRQDLRTSDNPALFEAAKNGKILPVFIFDNASAGQFKPGAASKWWLNHSLSSLNLCDPSKNTHALMACFQYIYD